jgi:hypothetical protein
METMNAMVKGKSRIVAGVSRAFNESEARASYEYLVKVHAKHGWESQDGEHL